MRIALPLCLAQAVLLRLEKRDFRKSHQDLVALLWLWPLPTAPTHHTHKPKLTLSQHTPSTHHTHHHPPTTRPPVTMVHHTHEADKVAMRTTHPHCMTACKGQSLVRALLAFRCFEMRMTTPPLLVANPPAHPPAHPLSRHALLSHPTLAMASVVQQPRGGVVSACACVCACARALCARKGRAQDTPSQTTAPNTFCPNRASTSLFISCGRVCGWSRAPTTSFLCY
jgi:hypothetical protein